LVFRGIGAFHNGDVQGREGLIRLRRIYNF
jgi:hypothetical protein